MKFLRQGIALAVLGAGLAAAPGLSASASPAQAPNDANTVRQMRTSADGSTTISREDATGQVGFIRAAAKGDLLPASSAKPAAKADAYLDEYADAFGAPRGQLVRDSVSRANGDTTVNYVQKYKGLPVFGTLLRAHVDAQGDLTGVNGEVVPDIKVDVDPTFSEDEASARAIRNVEAHPPGEHGQADTSGLKAADAELMVYRAGLVNGTQGKSQLVWRVEVTNGENIRDMVFVSADYGKPVNRYSMVNDALDRALYEADADRNLTKVWEEGDPLPGDLNEDQESMVRSTGEAYWFFRNAFGRDSYDGEGATMNTINNDPAIQCPNANWNGQTTNYCDGVSSDDVVAHEWGHAYTEYTHGLVYQWQAGALNESYSDIWGETVDLINGRLDEGEGNLNLPRPDGLCSSHTRGGIGVNINSPADVAGPCAGAAAAAFGPVFEKEGVTADVVVATDEENPEGPTSTDGCTPFTNAADIAGKWAFVDRGTCAFAVKLANAEDAGAAGILFGNNVAGAPISVSGVSELYGAMVTKADGDKIKSASGPVNVTVKDTDTAKKADSFRWLIGEKSDAFGGAIRDMWTPTCYGDPGKVTDAEYHCDTADNGGVHGNSAVPNHGYALLVDGGSYNGTTVEGIGLDKAANIYFKAMNEYQTPVSDFTDHADSLDAACADLTGKRINKLSTKEDDRAASNEKITPNDCAQVAAMAKAIELRTEPVQCNFEPLLPDEAGSPCGEGFDSRAVFSEKFDDGLEGWTQEEELPEGAVRGVDWESDFGAPQHDNGDGVAFAADPTDGDCIPDSDDISSANSLISPEMTVPEDGVQPVVSFDHYVATESGWDGGVVRVKVNGGEFTDVPADAYLANGPNMTMEAAPDNTSPLAGEEGFSGTDGGELHGSWGTSQIALDKLDVAAGDTVQIEFVMGRDGCNGFDGWYVDNVELTVCDEVPAVNSTTRVVGAPIVAKRKGAVPVTVKVSAKGATPTGRVSLHKGKKKVGQAPLKNGKVTLKVLRKNLRKGANHLVAKYAGTKTVNPSQTRFVIRVPRK